MYYMFQKKKPKAKFVPQPEFSCYEQSNAYDIPRPTELVSADIDSEQEGVDLEESVVTNNSGMKIRSNSCSSETPDTMSVELNLDESDSSVSLSEASENSNYEDNATKECLGGGGFNFTKVSLKL